MKKHELLLNMINDFLLFWFDYCDYFDVWRQNKNENVKISSMRYKTNVKIKINFEKNNFADLSIIFKTNNIIIFKREKGNQMKIASKVKKSIIRIFKVKSIKKV